MTLAEGGGVTTAAAEPGLGRSALGQVVREPERVLEPAPGVVLVDGRASPPAP